MKLKIAFLLQSLLVASCFSLAAFTPDVANSDPNSTIIRRDNYTTCYNHQTKCPDWVEWTLTAARLENNVSRLGYSFQNDPDLEGPQASPLDYTRNPYNMDRGHMCPAADNTISEEWMDASFYMTNICPQNHTLNEGLWCELEKRCRVYAKKNDYVRIVCGPVFDRDPLLIGAGKVNVPCAFFKVILAEKNGVKRGIAFMFSNSPLSSKDNIFTFVYPIDHIEDFTGLDFFSDLPENIQESFEAQVDESYWDIHWEK